MKILVLLNEGAGTLREMDAESARRRIADTFAAAGADAEVRYVDTRHLAQHAKEATQSDVDVIVAGGGDGTINTVAGVVSTVGRKAFGVLPLGTHNHFAKDLGMPLELDDAVRALATGRVVELPVGEVNGRLFLNFSAIGFHPQVVAERDEQHKKRGWNKWLAMLLAILRVSTRLPVHTVRLSSHGHEIVHRTPSIIICNNPYQMRAFGVEAASVPERGLLNVYVATKPRASSVMWLMLRAAFGTVHEAKHFDAMALPDLRVETRRRRLRVSIDGELTTLETPLKYRIRERAMRVLVPSVSDRQSAK